ncbi:hypothetical protein HAX54_049643 [Datura stramonium]|uniref:Serine-threonine/tyrosine-protein kinase catalytic domain-containing protein n=1 Tax=Datura stramonium TaxID=4076 RepID=A0ABS8SVV3_DATST|nr:hypothetical protein [Datura stramonium]
MEILLQLRTVFNTRQWVDEFFNEVNLIHGIEHKNLVKLLGCSIEGPESLLVYEFVMNKSLDQYLFADKTHLNWNCWNIVEYNSQILVIIIHKHWSVFSLMGDFRCQKKNAFAEDSGSLLQTVWKLYTTNQLTEASDPLLKGGFAEEASRSKSRASQIAQPPFLNSSLLAGGSIKSSIRSLVSNALSKLDESSSYTTTTGSSSMQSSSTGPTFK